MILFKREHIQPIIEGKKTQTRRTWAKQRVKVGSIHQGKTSYFDKPFAFIRITGLRRERLGDISENCGCTELVSSEREARCARN